MSYIKAFLETELDFIPATMDKYMGKYYNNVLYNGIPWMILILHIIHYLFDVLVNALLKKMRFKEYVRIRLKRSLWYLGFYACSFFYCSATAWKNNIQFPNQIKFIFLDLTEPISGHFFAGYALLSAFYASSFIWEGLQCSHHAFTYLFLTGFCAFTYFFRYIELLIMFASILSVAEVATESMRCIFCAVKLEGSTKNFLQSLFCVYMTFASVIYSLVIPINFALPLVRGLLYNSSSITLVGLNLTLWGWYISTIYSSPLSRLMQHQWYHKKIENKVPECVGSIIECALFQPRDDLAYNLKIIKQEIRERQERVNALKKPKKKTNVLLQTLKCMVALNRKIKDRKERNANLALKHSELAQLNKSVEDVDDNPEIDSDNEVVVEKQEYNQENETDQSLNYSINCEDPKIGVSDQLEATEKSSAEGSVEDSVKIEC